MNKHGIKNALILFALIVLLFSAKLTCFAQTKNSTQTDEQKRAAIVAALERAQAEVKSGRKFIDGLKEQVKAKQARIDELDKRDEKRIEIEASLQRQIDELNAAIVEQQTALKIREDEVNYLQKELKKVQKKLKSSYTREKVFAGSAAVLFLLLLLK